MALRVWLPLNGNMENKGLSNIVATNSGTIINNNGKIGQCYEFDGNDDFISIDYSQCFNKYWTYCCWIYNDDSGGRGVLYGDYGLSNTVNINIEKWTNETIRLYWNNSEDLYFSRSALPVGKWTHLALSYDGTEVIVYINGIKSESKEQVLNAINKTTGLFLLGRDNRTGTTAFKGKMNDFRLYDECLSSKQIREIAKGLVAHYKLDNYIDNLISNNVTQYVVMPEASAATVGKIAQYIGTTNGNYTNGYFYKGISRSILNSETFEFITTYDWSNIQVQISNLITDVSGNGYNANISGSLTLNNNSPRYNSSTSLNSTLINSPAGKVLATSKDFTINGWFYHISGTNYYASAENSNTSVCLENGRFFVYPTSGSAYVGTWQSTDNTWQMLTLVHNSVSQTLTLYINGVQSEQINTDGTIFANNTLNIGGRQNSAGYNGSISDFRIYATALSADDIKGLYQTSAWVDNENNVYAYNFVEEEE